MNHFQSSAKTFFFFGCLWCLHMANPASAMADIAIISNGAIASPWADWSWSASHAVSSSKTYNGAPSLAITYSAGWAGFSLDNATPVNTAGYTAIQFAVYGASGGGNLGLYTQATGSGAAGPEYTFTPTANVWKVITAPLSALGNPAQISRINIQDLTGNTQPTYYIDALKLAAAPSVALSLKVDATAARKPISPLIYGVNSGDASGDLTLLQELGISVARWGGNATSRYNYLLDASNTGNDWYYENFSAGNGSTANLPAGSTVNAFINTNKKAGAGSLVTVPMLGYVAKDGNLSTCGFSVAKYGAQAGSDPYRPNCGTGVKPGGADITGNNPLDTSIAITPGFVTNWVNYLVKTYGKASNGGVAFYNLDNEPDIWFSTHRDIAPVGLTYTQLITISQQYAAAIKAADPSALTLGPVVDGWTYYWNSPHDGQLGLWSTTPDRNAHGGLPLLPWYLQQMQAYETKNKVRLLDYLDVHYYPAENGVTLSPAGDAATQALRLQSTRSLWDPTYVDQSWIASAGPNGGIVQLIPLLRGWVNSYYPGTKLAISEYNWGAPESINGALAQADVLGIFGREGLDLATLWSPPTVNQPLAYAFRMYRNYDGVGGKFGDTSVSAVSSSQDQLAIYGSENSSNGALTLMVINKTGGSLTAPLTLSHFTASGTVQSWLYSAGALNQIVHQPDQTIKNNAISGVFPANSITLYVIPGQHS